MDKHFGLIFLLSVIFSATVRAGEYCITYYSLSYYTYQYEYCTFGCCGDIPYQECCAVYTWIIIVGVIGGVIFLSCIAGVVFCVMQQQGHRGRVINPAPQPGVSTVACSMQSQATAAPGMYNYGFQQPSTAMPYNQPVYPPPYQPQGNAVNPSLPGEPFPPQSTEKAGPP